MEIEQLDSDARRRPRGAARPLRRRVRALRHPGARRTAPRRRDPVDAAVRPVARRARAARRLVPRPRHRLQGRPAAPDQRQRRRRVRQLPLRRARACGSRGRSRSSRSPTARSSATTTSSTPSCSPSSACRAASRSSPRASSRRPVGNDEDVTEIDWSLDELAHAGHEHLDAGVRGVLRGEGRVRPGTGPRRAALARTGRWVDDRRCRRGHGCLRDRRGGGLRPRGRRRRVARDGGTAARAGRIARAVERHGRPRRALDLRARR